MYGVAKLGGRVLLLSLVPLLAGMGRFPLATAVTLGPVEAETLALDPQLLGRWRTTAADRQTHAIVEVRRSPTFTDRYELHIPWYFARPVEGRLVQLADGDQTWTVIECAIGNRTIDTGLLLPVRHHFGIRVEGEQIIVSLLSVQLGHMAATNSGARGSWSVRDFETIDGGVVAVIVADGPDIGDHLKIAARRMRPQWQFTFERER
jgi:hypothetical protein